MPERRSVPRDRDDDYTPEAKQERLDFLREQTGVACHTWPARPWSRRRPRATSSTSSGSAQVPMGLAGPLLVNGEHAQGEFYVPMATAEGTLVASYNRGMRLLHEAGGVTFTVTDDPMQRAPAFIFADARGARDFGVWLDRTSTRSRRPPRPTTSTGRLQEIEQYSALRILFTRFNYTTGDAAGQNMVGKATFAACTWIVENYAPGIERFFLESNFATDKKTSQVNVMRTRGKRVVAEAVIPDELMKSVCAPTAGCMYQARQTSVVGGFISGPTTTARTRPTASRRCSSPPARTWPTWPSRRRRSCTPS